MIVKKWFEESKTIIKVLAVCGFIFVMFALVYFLVRTINTGTKRLGDQVVAVDKTTYDKYNNTTVDGTEVTNALKNYIDSNMAIIIANSYTINNDTTLTSFVAPNFGILADQAHNSGDSYTATSGATIPTAKVSFDEKTSHWYLGEDGRKGKYGLDYSGTAWLRNKANGEVSKSQNSFCYVSSGSSWRADILYDPQTDTACGILFRQVR